MVAETKDIALYEIAERLEKEHGVRVVPSTVWQFFAKRGITYKRDGACVGTAAQRREGGARSLV